MEGQFRFHIGMGLTLFMAMLLLSLSATFHVNGRKLADKEHLGFRTDLVHVDSLMSPFSPGNISFTERMQRAIYRSKQRVQQRHWSAYNDRDRRIPHESCNRYASFTLLCDS
jgi:hypothetical protein